MINLKHKGIYTVYSISDSGDETYLGSTENLILDTGLDAILYAGGNKLIHTCVVSSDTSLITTTSNSLPSVIASTSNIVSYNYGAKDSEPYYLWCSTMFQFNPGEANGNLTKVGIKMYNGNLFSLALFKDINGDPTTIQPINNERLRVVYEYRVYFSTEPTIFKNLKFYEDSDTLYTVTVTPAYITSRNLAKDLDKGLYFSDNLWSGRGNRLELFTGPTGRVYAGPVDRVELKTDAFTSKTYIMGDFIKYYKLFASYNEFVHPDGIKSMLLETTRGAFQFSIDPPLKKTNNQFLYLEISIKQGR